MNATKILWITTVIIMSACLVGITILNIEKNGQFTQMRKAYERLASANDAVAVKKRTFAYSCGYLRGQRSHALALGFPRAAPDIPSSCKPAIEEAAQNGFDR